MVKPLSLNLRVFTVKIMSVPKIGNFTVKSHLFPKKYSCLSSLYDKLLRHSLASLYICR